MEKVVAIGKFLRGSAQKARIPAEVVKGMKIDEAAQILFYMNKKAAQDVLKVLKSAVSNAVHNKNLQPEDLIVEDVRVDGAKFFRRAKASSRGMSKPIKKRNKHITVVLTTLN